MKAVKFDKGFVALSIFPELAEVPDADQGVVFFLPHTYHGRGMQCMIAVPSIN